jgi:Txe/YoeB family toxin of Txe-Axe toxin-antitoxin module
MFSNQNLQKICTDFYCEKCDYSTSRKSSYTEHLMSAKHHKSMDGNENLQKICNEYICHKCSKKYKDNSGLWRHKKKCVIINNTNNNTHIEKNNDLDEQMGVYDLVKYLMKENSELKNMMIEQNNTVLEIAKNSTNTNSNNIINSHNKAFNLNFFLNETCKDAMNIMDFVESIQLQLSDLEKVGEIGYVEGISNIIVKNLNALDVTQRPVHCTDKKRETIYIKDEDKWEKDDEKNKIRKVIKKVATKNARLIQKFKEKHPDYNEYHSKYSTQYHKLIIESFGGSGDNDVEKEDKIIRNITKNIVVDKDTTK